MGEGNCESKIVSRQWGDNFCRGTSRCLAGPSGRKRGTEKGPESLALKGFFAPTRSIRQPLFEPSEISGRTPRPKKLSPHHCIREQKTVPLVNHAFARGTPAIFVVSRGLSSKTLVLLVRTQICHFRRFRQKPPCFGGTKARFTKSTVSWTPTVRRKLPMKSKKVA